MLIACVNQGTKYGPEYVTRLRDGVARHLSAPHEFVCFTDRPVSGVTCEPLTEGLPGWWSKMELFKMGRAMLYLDLDIIVTGDLKPATEMSEFTIVEDWWLPKFNSSVMRLTGEEGWLWHRFECSNIKDYPQGDQQFIGCMMPDGKMFPQKWFPSYKANKCQAAVPDGALAVVFHGLPKPHQCGGWVKELW